MPALIGEGERRSLNLSSVSYDYDYPDKMNLKPQSELHTRIVNEVMNRARESYNSMSARHPSWKKIDEVLTTYIKTDDAEAIVKAKDERKPVSIVVPQSYATMEILLTYLSVSLLESPIFKYEGRGPEDELGAIMLEKIIEHQSYYSKMALNLHTMFRDGLAYSMGVIAPRWTTETRLVSKQRPRESMFRSLLGLEPVMEKSIEEEILYEGNKLENIDPYLFLPDPNVAIDKMQDGEFVGWVSPDNLMNLLKDEKSDPENTFNVRYLKHLGNCKSTVVNKESSGRTTKTGMSEPTSSYVTNRVDVVYMYVDLIPRDWKLPGSGNNKNGDYPETWLFGVAADSIVICARPLSLNHGKKPVVVFSPEYDGYSLAPVSKMEIVNGLQTILDWLLNSHMTNVRKAINDMLIVDPSMVNMNDLESPEPGKLVRLRRAVWGRGVENAVKQLKVEDITRANVSDAGVIIDLMKGISGSVDAISGLRRKSSERVTAEEVRGDRFGGLSRLEKLAKICSWMALQDLGYMIASHTQQFLTQDTYIKTTGDWQDVLMNEYGVTANRMAVSPSDLMVNYDVIAKDGSVPGGNFSDVWTQMLPQILSQPELIQRMDGFKVVKYIMRSLGAKNVNQFDRKQMPNVMPDQQVAQQVQAGNLVPMEAMSGSEQGAIQ